LNKITIFVQHGIALSETKVKCRVLEKQYKSEVSRIGQHIHPSKYGMEQAALVRKMTENVKEKPIYPAFQIVREEIRDNHTHTM